MATEAQSDAGDTISRPESSKYLKDVGQDGGPRLRGG